MSETLARRLDNAEKSATALAAALSEHEKICSFRWQQVKEAGHDLRDEIREIHGAIEALKKSTDERNGVMKAASYGLAILTAVTGAVGAAAAYLTHR